MEGVAKCCHLTRENERKIINWLFIDKEKTECFIQME